MQKFLFFEQTTNPPSLLPNNVGSILPFEIIQPSWDDSRQCNLCASFKIPLNPVDPDGPKLMHKAQRLVSTHPKDILQTMDTFDVLVLLLGITRGICQFLLFATLLGSKPAERWQVICNDYPAAANQTNANFKTAQSMFVKL